MIGVVIAMEGEFENTLPNIMGFKMKQINFDKYKTYLCQIPNTDVVAVISGVGKINAAGATQYLIDNYKPEIIYNIGVCGATETAFKESPVVNIDMVVENDFDTSPIDGESFKKNIIYLKLTAPERVLYTSDKFTTNTDKIVGYFDMEGYAVARVCNINNIPCELIKSVTDIIGTENQDKQYDCNYEMACERLVQYISQIRRDAI